MRDFQVRQFRHNIICKLAVEKVISPAETETLLNGRGEDSVENRLLDRLYVLEACIKCDGDGWIYLQGDLECPRCKGNGWEPTSRTAFDQPHCD